MNRRRGDYGYDAPPALIGLTSIAILATILAVASWMTPAHRFSRPAVGYAVMFGLEAATMANARAEGVSDCVAVETGDMRRLPFADNTFDVIVSSLAIHNISGNAGRAAAVTEAMRVLKPGGRLAIADVRATSLYARTLRSLGATAVVRGRLGWRFWYGIAMTLVTATKAG